MSDAPIERIRLFLAQYDLHAENGVRRGLGDEFYGIDGGDGAGGRSLRLSDLRAVRTSHYLMASALVFIRSYLVGLEAGLQDDDPLLEMRRKFHGPLLEKIDAALTSAGLIPTAEGGKGRVENG